MAVQETAKKVDRRNLNNEDEPAMGWGRSTRKGPEEDVLGA